VSMWPAKLLGRPHLPLTRPVSSSSVVPMSPCLVGYHSVFGRFDRRSTIITAIGRQPTTLETP
jgi:hypothetical protein